jgi:hypothetical protein
MSICLVGCDASADKALSSGTGKGGSMARFAINGDYLYTVSDQNLNVFDITTPNTPVFKQMVNAGWDVETIFPYNDHLFLGTQNGMNILSIANPESPTWVSSISHVRSCDPVVVQGNYAYVTLRGGGGCGGANNQLDIINISNINSPQLLKTYGMNSPYGLGIDGNLLFVCDGNAGLKVFKLNSPTELQSIATFSNVNAYDVIPLGGNLLMIGNDGLYQYKYANNAINLVSKIAVVP